MFSQAFLLASLSASALAIPQDGNSCAYTTRYTVTNQVLEVGTPQQVSGLTCTSSADNYCEIGRDYSYAAGVTQTVSGSISGGLDLGKIFTLGIEAGYSYSWSTESATSTSVGVQCPAGKYECGLQGTATYVVTSGRVCKQPQPDGAFCQETQETCENYSVRAPSLIGDGPDNQGGRRSALRRACFPAARGI